MQISRSFLIAPLVLLLGFSEQGLGMKDESSDLPSTSRASRSPELPVEVQAHILSFLNQWDLLRAGGISKSWRQAAERIWKTKPLDLSNRRLNPENYKALVRGPFFSLILTSVHLGYEGARTLALTSRLKHLNLDSNSIGAEGAKALASGNLFALTMLSLCGNSIETEGKEALAKNVRLKVIY